jgi:hypothetical protein
LVGHVLDRRHRKGKVRVPEDKKAIAEVPESYKEELQELGTRLHQATLAVEPGPLGVARREQEEISKAANWAGYQPCPSCTTRTIPRPPCKVAVYLKRSGSTKQDSTFVLGLESYYSADPGVSNFKEEFLVIYGHHGVHLTTLLPITEIPYSRDGIPTMGIVQPLDGIYWIPTGTGNLSPGQHLQQQPGAVNMVTEDCQASGKGYFRGWIGQKPYLLLHDSGSPWTFHTSSFRKSFTQPAHLTSVPGGSASVASLTRKAWKKRFLFMNSRYF